MEEWKDVEGSPNYEVSNLGNVRHKTRKNLLKPRASPKGDNYICYEVNIADVNGGQHNRKIHRLVAMAFIPNPNNRLEVDHIDRNPANNKVENLRWVTHGENMSNIGMRSDNTSGETGVYSFRGKFKVLVKDKHIGVYDTMEEAVKGRQQYLSGEIEAPKQEGVLKEKWISMHGSRYRVSSRKKGFECRKCFGTLEEAVVYRDLQLNPTDTLNSSAKEGRVQ